MAIIQRQFNGTFTSNNHSSLYGTFTYHIMISSNDDVDVDTTFTFNNKSGIISKFVIDSIRETTLGTRVFICNTDIGEITIQKQEDSLRTEKRETI